MESLFTADTERPAQALQGDGQTPTPGVIAPVIGKEAAPPEATQAEATQESPCALDGQAPAPGVMAPDAESEAAPAEAGQESPCPRCGGKLVNPTSLGWCPTCGYCRSLAEDGAKIPLSTEPAARQTSPLGIVEF